MRKWGLSPLATIEELRPAPAAEEVFARLRRLPHCVFFDSALTHPALGRWSFLAADPFDYWEFGADEPGGLERLAAELARYAAPALPGGPPFQGGAAGLLSYDLGRQLEELPRPQRDEFQAPALALGWYDAVVALDHAEGRAWLISQGFPETDPARRRRRAEARLEQLRSWLADAAEPPRAAPVLPPVAAEDLAPQTPVAGLPGATSNFSHEAYLAAVRRVIDYIYAGDCYQVNLAQRLLRPAAGDAAELYLRLRQLNPAPFAGYFDLGEFQIVSASPERFLSVRDGLVEARPIKGTRRRGATPDEDRRAAEELLASPKDRAENVMIVDLLRNDLARTCRADSVRVAQACGLESYAHVHHMVSVIHGRLREGLTAVDLVRGAFPGGSITGAPKIRAMQIIAELEPTARGPYCGSLGYFGFDGSMDLSILIRTIVAGRGWWQLHVGGGIVADSDPQKEYEETWHKAQGMLQAMEGAGNADEYAVHQGEGEPPFNPGAAAMSYEPIEEGNPIRRIATLFDDADRRLIRTPKTPLPHWPLVSGVFTFPFRTHTLPIWLAMTMVVWLLLGAAFLSYVLLGAARVYDGTESGEFAVAMVGTALLMVGLPALSYLLSAMVLVVQETSQRADQVEDWRDPFGVEWIGSGLLGVFAAAASTAPGVLAGAVFLPEAPALVAAPLAFVLFPVLLLSMLQDGWYCPCSATVLRSLRLAWLGWIAFYAEAAALWAVCGGLCAAIGCVAESWLEFHPALTAAGVSLCVTATLFIYFRLLGRLVWLCNEKAEREEAAEDAAEDETPPDEQ